MRQDFAAKAWRSFGGVVFRVELHLLNWSDALGNTTDDDLGKELETISNEEDRTVTDLPG